MLIIFIKANGCCFIPNGCFLKFIWVWLVGVLYVLELISKKLEPMIVYTANPPPPMLR